MDHNKLVEIKNKGKDPDALPTVNSLDSSKKELRRLRQTIVNQYFPRAAWKRELDLSMTPLEALLTDPESMSGLGFFKSTDTSSVVESVCQAMLCKFNPKMCRGCFKPITASHRAKRKKKNKKRQKQRLLSCGECHSVYFCSDDCMIAGIMGRHKFIECEMLQAYRKTRAHGHSRSCLCSSSDSGSERQEECGVK